MRSAISMAFVFSLILSLTTATQAGEQTTISGLMNPESAAVGRDGKVYVTVIGVREKKGDGSVAIVEPSGKITTFAAGLDDPHGVVIVADSLYIADVKVVWKVDPQGKVEVYVGPESFPRPPGYLNDIAYDGHGNFFVSDSGDRKGSKGAIYRINSEKTVTLVIDTEASFPPIPFPNGVLLDDPDHLLIAEFSLGNLFRLDLNSGKLEKIGSGFGGTDGLAKDSRGRRFVGDWKNGKLYELVAENEPPRLLSDHFQSAADIALTPDGQTLLVPDMKGGTLTWFPIR